MRRDGRRSLKEGKGRKRITHQEMDRDRRMSLQPANPQVTFEGERKHGEGGVGKPKLRSCGRLNTLLRSVHLPGGGRTGNSFLRKAEKVKISSCV